jgi:gas vesicle structural protein
VPRAPEEEVALVELVNRVLDRGVLVTGEVTISVAGVDLLYVGLQLVLSSVETMRRAALEEGT